MMLPRLMAASDSFLITPERALRSASSVSGRPLRPNLQGKQGSRSIVGHTEGQMVVVR